MVKRNYEEQRTLKIEKITQIEQKSCYIKYNIIHLSKITQMFVNPLANYNKYHWLFF